MSEYLIQDNKKKFDVFWHIDTKFTACHIVSVASSETGIAAALQHLVLFICRKIFDSDRRRGKEVENKEWHFQEVAKGKFAWIPVWLTMKTAD